MITPRAAPALLHPLTGVSRSCLSPVRNDFADPLTWMLARLPGRMAERPGQIRTVWLADKRVSKRDLRDFW